MDLDFSEGKINNINFISCGNDGLDISNTSLNVRNFSSSNTGDKAISIGENSFFKGKNLFINNSFIGMGIKDGSEIIVDKVNIKNTQFPIAAYIKKKNIWLSNNRNKKLYFRKRGQKDIRVGHFK